MRNPSFIKSVILMAGLLAAAAASAQDIKVGYNGDLSASPSAQPCHAIRAGWHQTLTRSCSMDGRNSGHNPFSVTRSTGRPSKSSR